MIWAIFACLLWSTAYAGIKLGLQYDKPFHFAAVRFMIAGIVILPFTVSPGKYLKMLKEHGKVIIWVSFLQIFLNYALFYTGLKLVPGALGAVIAGSQPLVTALVASMVHDDDKLTTRKIITIISGIAGVILISAGRQAFRFGTPVELIGVVMILFANIAAALGNIVVSLKSRELNPYVLSSSSLFAGGLVLYIISLVFEGRPSLPLPVNYWVILLWLSFMGATAFSLWFHLLQRPGVKVSELNLWKFIIPVVGALLSWLLVPDEKPEWITVTGMVIITGSLMGFFMNNKKSQQV